MSGPGKNSTRRIPVTETSSVCKQNETTPKEPDQVTKKITSLTAKQGREIFAGSQGKPANVPGSGTHR